MPNETMTGDASQRGRCEHCGTQYEPEDAAVGTTCDGCGRGSIRAVQS